MSKTDRHFDVAVIGGGATGLASVAAMAKEGLKIICFDKAFGFEGEKKGDTRTIALLQNSVYMLQNLGLWDQLGPHAQPLDTMKVIDDTGRFPRAPDAVFEAREIGPDPFGYNIANDRLVSALAAHAQKHDNVELHQTQAVSNIKTLFDKVLISTSEGENFSASLVIGADGPTSLARRKADIGTSDWRYDQSALACWFSHSLPHYNISTEYHRPSGPLVIVPMQGHKSGLVWVEKPAEADRLLALDDKNFADELQQATHGSLGTITAPAKRSLFPLSGLTARQFASGRTVLVGHAAHVLPPIGAQGLNLGLRDAAMIADIATRTFMRGEDVGGKEVIEHYNEARRADVLSRTFAADFLNRSLLYGKIPPLQIMRGIGVQLLNHVGPLRKAIMREGIGPQSNLPPLMHARKARTFQG